MLRKMRSAPAKLCIVLLPVSVLMSSSTSIPASRPEIGVTRNLWTTISTAYLDPLVQGLSFSPYSIWIQELMAIKAVVQRPKHP